MAANGAAKKHSSTALILDYGSQYTQLICRRVRELGVYSVMLPGDVTQVRLEAGGGKPQTVTTVCPAGGAARDTTAPDARAATPLLRLSQERVLEIAPSVVILSGGPNSVHEAGSPTVPPGFFEWAAAAKVPVLGICYGMQLLVQRLGGEVAPADKREYGRMPIATQPGGLFAEAGSQMVWMSHGDEAKRLPDGFVCVAKSEQVRRRLLAPPGFLAAAAHARGVQGAVVAVECKERNVYGLQYHPEARGAQLAPPQGAAADVALLPPPRAGDAHRPRHGDASPLPVRHLGREAGALAPRVRPIHARRG